MRLPPGTAERTARAIARAFEAWKPPTRLNVWQWAEQNVRLPIEDSAEPGAYSTRKAPYQRLPQALMTDPDVSVIAMMFGSQTGKTRVLLNCCAYFIAADPAPILAVQPTLTMAEEFSEQRVSPMLEVSPALDRLRSKGGRKKADTMLRKKFATGAIMGIAGANSPSSLASRPIRVLVLDETDRYPPSAGSEGDPVTIAQRRTNTFHNRVRVEASSPTIQGRSRIEKTWLASDRRRLWLACPACGEKQTLKWDQVRVAGKHPEALPKDPQMVSAEDYASARYECERCGDPWTDARRHAAVAAATDEDWRPEAPFNGVAGFHLSELYSPFYRLAQTVADFVAARHAGIEAFKAWKNTALAELWKERGEAPEWERLAERREPYAVGVLPKAVRVLTAGADVQRDRIVIDVWGWAPGFESWIVDRVTLPMKPDDPRAVDSLREVLNRPWKREGGGTAQIAAMAVDSGDQTMAVYRLVRAVGEPARCYAVKGTDGFARLQPVSVTPVDVLDSGRRLRRGLKLRTVATGTFKSELYGWLWADRPLAEDLAAGAPWPRGWVHVSEGMEADWCKELVAEELRTTPKGRREWVPIRPRNEALDCRVYARAALWGLGADRQGDAFWGRFALVGTPDVPVDLPATQAPPSAPERGDGPAEPSTAPPSSRSGRAGGYFAPRRDWFGRR